MPPDTAPEPTDADRDRADDRFRLAALTAAAALVGLLGLNAWVVGPAGGDGYLPVASDLTWLLAVGTALLVAASRR